MTGSARETPQPFPGSEHFSPPHVARLTRTIAQVKELQPLAARSISERTGVGGWLPSGFGDTQGMAVIEGRVRARGKAMIALEAAKLLGNGRINDRDMPGFLDIVNDRTSTYEDMPSRVFDYLSSRQSETR